MMEGNRRPFPLPALPPSSPLCAIIIISVVRIIIATLTSIIIVIIFWISSSSIFTNKIKAKLNELESESNVFLQNEGKDGKSELTPVVKALTNCAMVSYHPRDEQVGWLLQR